MAAAKKPKAKVWVGDREYARQGQPEQAPCPKCGETERIARRAWDCWVNACYACGTLYDVPPLHDEDGKPIVAKEKKSRKKAPKRSRKKRKAASK